MQTLAGWDATTTEAAVAASRWLARLNRVRRVAFPSEAAVQVDAGSFDESDGAEEEEEEEEEEE